MSHTQRLSLAAALALGICMVLSMATQSGFIHDDFINLNASLESGGWTAGYLSMRNFDHFAPGQRALNYLVFGKDRGLWANAVLTMLFLQITNMYLAFRFGRLLATPWCGIVCAAVIGLSPIWCKTWLWFASAADFVLTTPAMLLAFEMFQRRLQGSRLWTVGIALALAASLASRERSVVLPVCMFVWALILTQERLRPAAIARNTYALLVRLADVWVGCGVVLAPYAWYWIREGFLSSQLPGHGSPWASSDPVQITRFMVILMRDLFIPSLTGIVPLFFNNALWAIIVASVLSAALLIGSFGFFERAGRAWSFFLISCTASMLPLALGRAGDIGLWAHTPRYLVDQLPFVPLTLAFLWREAQAGRVRYFAASTSPRKLFLATAGSATALVIFSFASNHSYRLNDEFSFRYSIAKAFVAGVRNLETGENTTVLDSSVPLHLVLGRSENEGRVALLSSYLKHARPEVSMANVNADFLQTFELLTGVRQKYKREKRDLVALNEVRLGAEAAAHSRGANSSFCIDDNEEPVNILFPSNSPLFLVEIEWDKDAPLWVTSINRHGDGEIARGYPLPAAISKHPTSVICSLENPSHACGIELPAHAKSCIRKINSSRLSLVTL